MSLFDKICSDDSGSKEAVLESITNQIAVIFANRNDQYWAFDIDNKAIIQVHDLFKQDIFSVAFSRQLARVLEVFDRRIKDVSVVVTVINSQTVVFISGYYVFGGAKVPITNLKFSI